MHPGLSEIALCYKRTMSDRSSNRDEQCRRLSETMRRQLGSRVCDRMTDSNVVEIMLNADGVVIVRLNVPVRLRMHLVDRYMQVLVVSVLVYRADPLVLLQADRGDQMVLDLLAHRPLAGLE